MSKLTTWDDRDRAIKAGLGKFNNKTAEKIAVDKGAHFGCKGGNKFWCGYKEHASVDMQSSLIIRLRLHRRKLPMLKGLLTFAPQEVLFLAISGAV